VQATTNARRFFINYCADPTPPLRQPAGMSMMNRS
jgi:hypothetical protein